MANSARGAESSEQLGDVFLFAAVTDEKFPEFIQNWQQHADEPISVRVMPEQILDEYRMPPILPLPQYASTLNQALLPRLGISGVRNPDAGKLLAHALTEKVSNLWIKLLQAGGYIPKRDAEHLNRFRDAVWEQAKKPLPPINRHG